MLIIQSRNVTKWNSGTSHLADVVSHYQNFHLMYLYSLDFIALRQSLDRSYLMG